MNCTRVRQILNDSEGRLRLSAGWLHLAHCRACRAEARSVRLLRRALGEIRRCDPPGRLLARILDVPVRGTAALDCDREAMRGHPNRNVATKGDQRMRRLVFAGAALLVVGIAAAVVIPGRWGKPDARSILIAAAQAAEDANMVYAVVRGTEDTKDTPSGMKLGAGTTAGWISTRAMFGKVTLPDGMLAMAIHMDLDAKELWVYVANKGIRYVADFAPIAPKAGKLLAGILDQSRWAGLPGTAKRLFEIAGGRDVRESVTSERRDGREVRIVTVTSTLKTSPRRIADRWVLEVDAESHHLLAAQRYVRADQGPYELILSVDRIEYDVPVPPDLSNLQIPEGTKTAPATATVEETENKLSLVMKADGKVFMRSEVWLAPNREP